MRLFVRYRRWERGLRGLFYAAWIRSCGGTVGQRFQVDRRAHFRWRPHRGWSIGSGVYLGVGTVLDIGRTAEFTLGDDVKIMHYSVVASSESVRIGHASQVAEHSSIRDADHGLALDRPIRDQTVTSPVVIGQDVWIGRGVAVLRGSVIGDGTVVGANSVVRGSLAPRVVAVGAPARVVRERV